MRPAFSRAAAFFSLRPPSERPARRARPGRASSCSGSTTRRRALLLAADDGGVDFRPSSLPGENAMPEESKPLLWPWGGASSRSCIPQASRGGVVVATPPPKVGALELLEAPGGTKWGGWLLFAP